MNKKSNEFSGISMPNFQMYLATQNFKTLKNVNQLFEAKKKNERSVSPISNQILINNNFINIQTINSATPSFTKKIPAKKESGPSNFHNHRNIVKKNTRSVSPNEIQNFTKQNFFINIENNQKPVKEQIPYPSNKPYYLQNKKNINVNNNNNIYQKKQPLSLSQTREKKNNNSDNKYKNLEFLRNYLDSSGPNSQREYERERSLENYLENKEPHFLSSQRKNYRAKTTVKKTRNISNNNYSAEKSYENPKKNSFVISKGSLAEPDNLTERFIKKPQPPQNKRTISPNLTTRPKQQFFKPLEDRKKITNDMGFNVKQYKKLIQEMNNLELARLSSNALIINPNLIANTEQNSNYKTSSRRSLINKTKKSEENMPKKTEESLKQTKKSEDSLSEIREETKYKNNMKYESYENIKPKIKRGRNLFLEKIFSKWVNSCKDSKFINRCLEIAHKSFLGIELFVTNFTELQESCETIQECSFIEQILETEAFNGPSEQLDSANVLLSVLSKKIKEFVLTKNRLMLGGLLNKLDFFRSTSLDFIVKWEDYNEKLRIAKNWKQNNFSFTKKQRMSLLEKMRQKIFKLFTVRFLQALFSFQLKNQQDLTEAMLQKENLKKFVVILVCEKGNIKAFPSPSDLLASVDGLFASFEEPLFKMKELQEIFEFIKDFLPNSYDFESVYQENKQIAENKDNVTIILTNISANFDQLTQELTKENLPKALQNFKKILTSPQKNFELFKEISEKHLYCQKLLDKFSLESSIEIGCLILEKSQAILEYTTTFNNLTNSFSKEFQDFFNKELDETLTPLRNHFAVFEKKASSFEEHLQQKHAVEFFEANQQSFLLKLEELKQISKEFENDKRLEELEQILNDFPKEVKNFTSSLKSTQQNTSFKINEKYEILKDKYMRVNNELKPFVNQFGADAEKVCKALEPIEGDITAFGISVQQFFKYNAKLTKDIIDPVVHDEKQQMENNITKNLNDLKELFEKTKKIWGSMFEFRKKKREIIETEFVKAQFGDVRKLLDELIEASLPKVFRNDVESFSKELENIELLKEKSLQPKHWQQIFEKLNQKSLLSQGFKVKDLMSAFQMEKTMEYLHEIISDAKKEQIAHKGLDKIKKFYENVDLKVTPHENRVDLFVLKDFEEILMKIEEDQISLENLKNNKQISNEIGNYQIYLIDIKEKIQLWEECQRKFLGLEWLINTFSEKDLFYYEINSYLEIFAHYKKIMWMVNNNPKLSANLIKNRFTNFKKLITALEKVSQHTGKFLDAQREFFPRYYFFQDEQLIEFLSQLNKNKDYQRLLNYLFPGISNFIFSYFGDNAINSNIIKIKDNSKDNNGNLAEKSAKILGIASNCEEELIFNKPLVIKKGGIAEMLPQVEDKMKSAVSGLINKAVSAFPNYSLDEWILEYPCQIVITSLHMIVSHEILEMIKILQTNNKNDQKVDSDSSSEINDSNINKEKPEDNNSHVSESDIHEILKKPLELTPKTSQKRITVEVQEMFGNNVIGKYLGIDKDDNINLLQKKSFQGLYLRLQFWINQLVQFLNTVDKFDSNSKKIESILLFVLFLKDVVLDLYENNSLTISDFSWNKHIRIIFDQENNSCLVECGGWSGYQGNEFLGSLQRMLISPLTEKYFVFISSALREKSGVAFKNKEKEYLCEVIEEFASICSVCQMVFYVGKTFALENLFRVLRGGVYASVWVGLEHVNNLDLEIFRIVSNEILLTQQKYILSEINNDDRIMTSIYLKNADEDNVKNEEKDSEKKFVFEKPQKIVTSEEIKRKLDKINDKLPEKNYLDEEINIRIEDFPKNKPYDQPAQAPKRPAYGLFASYNNNLIVSQPCSEEFLYLLQSGFRISSFQPPQLKILFETQLFIENFINYEALAKILSEAVENIQELSFSFLWISQLIKKACEYKKKMLENEEDFIIFDLEKKVLFEVFAEFIESKGHKEQAEYILLKHLNKTKHDSKHQEMLVACLEHNQTIFVCGEPLSGKSYLIEKAFSEKKQIKISANWLFSYGNMNLKSTLLQAFSHELVIFEKERISEDLFESFLLERAYKGECTGETIFIRDNNSEIFPITRDTKLIIETVSFAMASPNLLHLSSILCVPSENLTCSVILRESLKDLRKEVFDLDGFLQDYILTPLTEIEGKSQYPIAKNLCLSTLSLFRDYHTESLQIKPLFFLTFLQVALCFDKKSARIAIGKLFDRAATDLEVWAFFKSPPDLSRLDSYFFDSESKKFVFQAISESPKLLNLSELYSVFIPTRETANFNAFVNLLHTSKNLHSITILGRPFSGKSSIIFNSLQNTKYLKCTSKLPNYFSQKFFKLLEQNDTIIHLEDISLQEGLDLTSILSYLQQNKSFTSKSPPLQITKSLRELSSNNTEIDKYLIKSLIFQIDLLSEPSLTTIFKGLCSAFQCPEKTDSLLNLFNELCQLYKDISMSFFIFKKVLFVFANRDFENHDQKYSAAFEFFHWISEKSENVEAQELALQTFRRAMGLKIQRRELLHPESIYIANPAKASDSSFQMISELKNSFFKNKSQLATIGNLQKLAKMVSEINFGWNFIIENANMPIIYEFAQIISASLAEFPYEKCLEKLEKLFSLQITNQQRKILVVQRKHIQKKECMEALVSFFLNLGFLSGEKVPKIHVLICLDKENELLSDKNFQKIRKNFIKVSLDSNLSLKQYLNENKTLKNEGLIQAISFLQSNSLKNLLQENLFFGWKQIKNDCFLGTDRIKLFLNCYQQIYEKMLELFQKHENKLKKFLEKIAVFFKNLETNSEKNCMAAVRDCQIKVRLEEIELHMKNIEKDLIEKTQIVTNKKHEKEQLTNNLETLQKELNSVFKEKNNELQGYIDKINGFTNEQFINFLVKKKGLGVLEALAILIANESNVEKEKILKYFSNKNEIVKQLQKIDVLPVDALVFSEFCAKLESNKEGIESNILLCLSKWAETFKEKVLLYQRLKKSYEMKDKIKNNLLINTQKIEYNQKLTQELHTDNTKFVEEKAKLLEERKKLAPLLKEAEKSIQKKNQLLSKIITIQNKTNAKIEKITNFKNNLNIDCILITIRIVYFTFLNNTLKSKALALLLKEFKNDSSSFRNDEDFEKFFKFVLKLNDFDVYNYKFLNSIQKGIVLDSLFIFEFVKASHLCVWDDIGSFKNSFLEIFGKNNLKIYEDPLKSNEIVEQSQKISEFQSPNCKIFISKFSFNNHHELRSRHIILNFSELNLNDSWMDLKEILIKSLLPEKEKLDNCRKDFFSIKKEKKEKKQSLKKLLKEKIEIELETVSLRFNEINNLSIASIKQLSEMDNTLNEHPLLASYSNILTLMCESIAKTNQIWEEPSYTWAKIYKIIDDTIKKIIRDFSNKKKAPDENDEDESKDEKDDSENDQLTIDEDFFHTFVIVAIWNVFTAQLSSDAVPFASLYLALKVSQKKQSISENQIEAFWQKFTEFENYLFWKNEKIFLKIPYQTPFGNYASLTQEALNQFTIYLTSYNIYSANLQAFFSKLKPCSYDKYEELLQKNKTLTLIEKIYCSFLGKKANLRARLTQLIYEELTSIFDFSEDLAKFHHFIKIASWHCPVSVFPDKNVNSINTICSIASYYGVELEVVEECDSDFFKKLESATTNGNWILISSENFTEICEKCIPALESLEKNNKMLNSFRLLFDFHSKERESIPIDFLCNFSVIFKMGFSNMEDMEGFNDVWANILNDNLLSASLMQDNPSKIFPNHSIIHPKNTTVNTLESSQDEEIPKRISINNNTKKNKDDNNIGIVNEFDPLGHKLSAISVIINNSFEANEQSLIDEYNVLSKNI